MSINASGAVYSIETFTLSAQGSQNMTGATYKGQFLMTAFQPGFQEAIGTNECASIGLYEPLLNACNTVSSMLNKTIFVYFDDGGILWALAGISLMFGLFIYVRRKNKEIKRGVK